jgi:polysaccharide export outer membrane protein
MKRTFLLFYCIVLIIILIAPQIFAGDKITSAPNQKSLTRVEETSYKIGGGDILQVTTWREPDFSLEEILVRIDGKITLPLLDDIQAAGLTSLELKKDIQRKLKKFVGNPNVTVTVRSPASQKFYILGEVAQTGEYALTKELTVLQAFALAGGFTEWASKKEIILLRREEGKEKIIRVNYKNIIKGKDFSQNVRIKANDTIIVP